MLPQPRDLEQFITTIEKNINTNGYVCIHGYVKKEGSNSLLKASILGCDDDFTLLDKKSDNIEAYTRKGFPLFVNFAIKLHSNIDKH